PRVITVTTNSPPDGYLDSALGPTNTSTVPAGTVLTVKGWAADLEDGAPVTKVEVRIDGIVVGNATLGFARNDVATYYGRPAWTNSGWQFQTTPSLSSG